MKTSLPAENLRDVLDTMSSLNAEITSRLSSLSDTPALDASVLLARIVERPRSWILAHPELTLTNEQQDQLDASLARLEDGEPFPYVLGRWEFFGLEFEVTPDVLIPRPETELLVEKAIAWLQKNPTKMNVADIGTGSGAIAVSIAVNFSNANVLATDISKQALQVAKRNAEKHGVSERVEFVECDLLPHPQPLSPLRLRYRSAQRDWERGVNLVCSNLPYIPTGTLKHLPIYQREPTVALDGGEDGLDVFRKLLNIIPDWLAPNALILLEIESTLGEQTTQLARQHFPNSHITLHQDLTGRDRLLEIQT